MAAGDTFTPDAGQRIDAQGHVTYDFTGHISAEGLDLNAVTTGGPVAPSPPDDRRVRWLRESDGSLVAEVFGFDPSFGKRGLWVGAGPNPSPVTAPLPTRRLILDEDGRSGFVQLEGSQRTRFHFGKIGVNALAPGTVAGPLPLIIVGGLGTPYVTTGIRDFGNASAVTVSGAVVSATEIDFFIKNNGLAPATFEMNWHLICEF
jgi:hypothetical protein